MKLPLKVMKFGGTSVGAVGSLRCLVDIVVTAARSHQPVVVVSAASGVTDQLVAAWDALDTPDFDAPTLVDGLHRRYAGLAEGLLGPPAQASYREALTEALRGLSALLASWKAGERRPAHRDALLATGERLSVPLVAAALGEAGLPASGHDAAALIRTDATFGEAAVDLDTTFRHVRAWHRAWPLPHVPVVPGFIGATADGHTTTLGRGGSDYSAALLASALRADVLERWTDVDGIYTADPKKDKDARRLSTIVLEEAWSWNHAGKLGMHRKALDPLVAAGIPVHVRCTAEPEKPGTLILPAHHELAHRAATAPQPAFP